MYAWEINCRWEKGVVIASTVEHAAKKWKEYSKKSKMQPTDKSSWNIESITNRGKVVA